MDPKPSSTSVSDLELQRQREAIRRNLLRVNLAAGVILFVVVGLAVAAIIQAAKAERNAQTARDATARVERQRMEAEQAEQQAREDLLQSYLQHARSLRRAGLAGSRFDSLAALAAAARIRVAPELRSEAIASLAVTDLRESSHQQPLAPTETIPVFNSTLDRFAVPDFVGQVRVRDLKDGHVLAELSGAPAPVGWERFSPDNRRLSVRYVNGVVRVWDLASTNVVVSTAGDLYFGFDGAVDFTPDSQTVAIAHDAQSIRLYDTTIGAEKGRLTGSGPKPAALRFSPDGRSLAVANNNELQIWNVAGARREKTFIAPGGIINKINWSPVGPFLAGATADGSIEVVNVESGEQRTFKGHRAGAVHVAFSNNGKLLVSDALSGETRLWDSRTGENLLTTQTGFGTWFTPDDQSLGYFKSNEKAGWWDVVAATTFHRLPADGPPETYGESATSPDQSLAAIVASPREIHIQDSRTHETLAVLTAASTNAITGLAFDPLNGALVAATRSGGRLLLDLPQIGRDLATIGLGWADRTPPIARASTPSVASHPAEPSRDTFTLIALGGVLLAIVTGVFVLRRHAKLISGLASTEALVARRNRELELAHTELLHGQKMRALGTLAAGIAHDFNNLLSIIRMANKLTAREARGDPEILENTASIEQAVDQGKSVVRSMLGYGREPEGGPTPFSLAELVEDSVALLSRQFLSGITLTLELDRTLPPVSGAKGRIEQILLNLLVNASEAMDGTGELRIAVCLVDRVPADLVLRPAHARTYLQLTVADSGPGIPPEILPRIFEPFYTTKVAGAQRGTGLGLSMVYTIAQQDGLGLEIETAPGRGTAFRVLIPV